MTLTLTGDVARYELFVDALRAVSPLPIEFAELNGADGRMISGEKIEINTGMSEIQTVCAIIHEITHAKLHDATLLQEGEAPKDRRTEEVEAESVAFSVSQYFGLETGANSFGYIADWSRGKELKELNASLDTIRKTAAALIEGIDEQYHALAKERGIDLTVAAETVPVLVPIAEAEMALEMTPETAVTPEMTPETATTSAAAPAAKLTELQLDGLEYANRNAHLPLQGKIHLIAEAFNCKTGTIQTTPCTGKWRGTSDVSIVLDSGSSLFIGNRRTPQVKTAKVQTDLVDAALTQYHTERITKAKALATAALLKRETEDNAVAAEKGLKPYTFLNVEFNDGSHDTSGGYMGWYFVTLAVDGNIFGFVETGLNYDIADGKLAERSKNANYFLAGNYKEADVDFVFNNVGHSSFKGGHTMPLSDAARERAEEILKDRTEVKNTMEHELYEKFAEMFPDFLDSKYSYLRLEASGFEPLSFEWIDSNRISVMHTYTQNGDLMYDPMIEYEVDGDAKTLTAVAFQQSMPPLYQERQEDGTWLSVDGNGHQRTLTAERASVQDFSLHWLNNISEQGHKPVRGTMDVNGDDIRVTFDANGVPKEVREPVGMLVFHDTGEIMDYFTAEDILAAYKSAMDSLGADKVRYRNVVDEELEHKLYTLYAAEYGEVILPLEPKDKFYINADSDTVGWMYYNPDSAAGGQYVMNGISYDLIREAAAATDDESAFFDYIGSSCKQNSIDITDPYFAGYDNDFKNNPYAFGSCTADTMNALIALAREKAQSITTVVSTPETNESEYPYPDPSIAESERDLYGYTNNDIYPLTMNRALELYAADHTIYLLHEDNTETMVFDRDEIDGFGGLFGIEREEWNEWCELHAVMSVSLNSEPRRESELLHGHGDMFGIYQLKDGDETLNLRFASYGLLEKHGFTLDRDNYSLVYSAPLNGQDLEKIYENFNINHPADFTGHSLSVSDVVVLKQGDEVSAHYVDSVGFVELATFTGEERKSKSRGLTAEDLTSIVNSTNANAYAQLMETEGAEPEPPTLFQVETSTQPTVAELKADVKAGKTLSLADLARATNAERQQPAKNGKPSLLAELRATKERVAQEKQPDTGKKKDRGYE